MTLPDGVHTKNHIIFILTFWLGCYGVWFVFSLCLRYFTKKPIVPHVPKTAVFHAERCSGRLLRDAMRPIKSLRGSLLVYIADQNLYVVPRFPFNLISVHNFYSFEFAVPLAAITTIEPIEHLEGGAVRINFNSAYRAPIELDMKDAQTFIDILRSAIPQTKTGST